MPTQSNREFWKKEGSAKTFTHPLYADWIKDLAKETPVLDFGCGYGRLTPDLQHLGFTRLYGYDSSKPLIERAAVENPGAFYTDQFDALGNLSFTLVTCFAVFTSCPLDIDQLDIVSSIESVTDSGAVLYISDYLMDDNPHYRARYEQCENDTLGCFRSGNGFFRHHPSQHFETLLSRWTLSGERAQQSKTMNGNDIVIHQYRFVRD